MTNPKPPKLIARKGPRKLQKHELEDLLRQLKDFKSIKEAAEDKIALIQQTLVEQCALQGLDSLEVEDDGMIVTGTVVSPERTEVDIELLNAIPEHLAEQILQVVESVDKKALEVMLDRGELDPEIVKQYTKTKPSKPYIRVSEKKSYDGKE